MNLEIGVTTLIMDIPINDATAADHFRIHLTMAGGDVVISILDLSAVANFRYKLSVPGGVNLAAFDEYPIFAVEFSILNGCADLEGNVSDVV